MTSTKSTEDPPRNEESRTEENSSYPALDISKDVGKGLAVLVATPVVVAGGLAAVGVGTGLAVAAVGVGAGLAIAAVGVGVGVVAAGAGVLGAGTILYGAGRWCKALAMP